MAGNADTVLLSAVQAAIEQKDILTVPDEVKEFAPPTVRGLPDDPPAQIVADTEELASSLENVTQNHKAESSAVQDSLLATAEAVRKVGMTESEKRKLMQFHIDEINKHIQAMLELRSSV